LSEGALLLQVKDRIEDELREDLATLKPEEVAFSERVVMHCNFVPPRIATRLWSSSGR
jgi:hypothetical protein